MWPEMDGMAVRYDLSMRCPGKEMDPLLIDTAVTQQWVCYVVLLLLVQYSTGQDIYK